MVLKKSISVCLLATIALLGYVPTCLAVTYSVVAAPPQNMSVAVQVDAAFYPLKPEHGILYKGEGPDANTGYKYVYINDASTEKIEEGFTRLPSSTMVNEFFNRSSNVYNINTLPQVLSPLDSIHRIDSELHIQNQIPTLHIYGDQAAIDQLHANQTNEELSAQLNFAYIGSRDVHTFENVEVSLAGRSSRWLPKLSYNLKLDKKQDATLFGYKNLKLRALATDATYLKESICYNVLKSAGLAVSGFSYIRLFINNQPIGLFGIIENFQEPWTAAVFGNGESDYVSGYVYEGISIGTSIPNKPVASDLRYEGTDINFYNGGQYKIKAGPNKKEASAYKGLQAFTKFVNESTVEKTTPSEWEKRLDVSGFLRAMALEDLLDMVDAYMTNANNFALYLDPKKDNRAIYIPFDMDASLGTPFLYNVSTQTSGNYAEHPGIFLRPLTKAILAYPDYLETYKKLLLQLTTQLFNPEIMFPYIDSVLGMIRVDIEWDSGLKRVGKISVPEEVLGGGFIELVKQLNLIAPEYLANFNTNVLNSTIPNIEIKDYITKKSQAVIQFYQPK